MMVKVGFFSGKVEGKSTIAFDLGITKKNTAKSYTRILFSKIGVNDRTQAAVFAIKCGLVVLGENIPYTSE
jgi:DNA-binding NarL/FixJ family response regulator